MIFQEAIAPCTVHPIAASPGLPLADGGGESTEGRWYVLHAKPHQEQTVESQLQQMGMEVFCPRLKQNKIVRRRRKTVVTPLFPGYLFSRFRLRDQYRAVTYARGVRRVVCFGSTPAPVDDRLIEGIRARHVEGCVVLAPHRYAAGQPVKVREGSLCGLAAVFERELSGAQRAVLLLKALSYQARVIVDLDQIAAA